MKKTRAKGKEPGKDSFKSNPLNRKVDMVENAVSHATTSVALAAFKAVKSSMIDKMNINPKRTDRPKTVALGNSIMPKGRRAITTPDIIPT